MASNTGGSLNVVIVVGEEVPHVTDLEEEESEPVNMLGSILHFMQVTYQ
jgi:hypothetical protein